MEFPAGMNPLPQQYQPPQAPVNPAPMSPQAVRVASIAPPQPPVPVAAPGPQAVQSYEQEVRPQPEVQVVRRNLTVAELIAVLIIAMIGVSAVQFVWDAIPRPQVNIEWKR